MKFKIESNQHPKIELEIDDELIALNGDRVAQAKFIGREVTKFMLELPAAQLEAQS